ncbi:MAG: hydrolase [Burkholderiales bacterium]|jgi:8-oxo-dGTP pyrophosphatase MutT (NUDIX family)|nr:hydrolase [Burkholderiales bacterium]
MSFKPARFVRFMAAGRRIGWLRPELAARLRGWPAVFTSNPDKVVLLDPKSLSDVVEQLAQEGFIPGWRDERYRIEDLFDIERAAARPFGLTTRAVHLNGISFDGKMWLARRAPAKAIDPGLLDNLVGGGVASGLTPEQTLVKEAWEEAGIPAELARGARRGGTVKVLREVLEGVQSELIDVYNLALPPEFAPRNQDGEVAEFSLLSFDEVRACGEMTHEAKLVALEYLRSSAR